MTNFKKFDPLVDSPKNLPNQKGVYVMCLREDSKILFKLKNAKFKRFSKLRVLYVGLTNKSLRNRDCKQHFFGKHSGSSTLRRSVGSLFGYTKIPRDKNQESIHYKFKEQDELKISNWMLKSIIMYYKTSDNPKYDEKKLISNYDPPFNIKDTDNFGNKNFRKILRTCRKFKKKITNQVFPVYML